MGELCRLQTLPGPSVKRKPLDLVTLPGIQEDKEPDQESPIQNDLGAWRGQKAILTEAAERRLKWGKMGETGMLNQWEIEKEGRRK